ncbi:SDR family oxidoreductase [Polynucleobacter paneuropaeus]|jgi:UDP-glucose 4-epimerase|nr:SDR family oxidoreductase [Polynucleobacter paneuropaeus]MBT8576695.1 SDR family oxidoreductase [Polynucleobacter paneuropaeus]MBT8615088.1 SDR family oxidoreductase [Polynucleobacter paneuropaeus]MBT8616569.1 SDR family oxidoreductase [Polynucleobacter paneuropaeus]MBT8618450.1 SDR family oxidoreductase [Polynucleobacter paneuropaeus]
MNILVVGATGLLGGRIAEYFLQQGHRIILGIRNFSKKDYFKFSTAEYLIVDLENLSDIEDSLSGVDLIVFAAGLNASESFLNPRMAMGTRGVGTEKLIEAAIKSRVKKFIYISSAHVYKSPLTGIFDEMSPLLNENIYALSHRAGEDALVKSILAGDISGIVLRIANGFGRPIDARVNCWSLLANDLCRQGVECGTLTLKGSCTSVRNFIPITEVCEAIAFFAERLPISINDEKLLIANLGAANTFSNLEFAKIICDRFSKVLKIMPKITLADNSRMDSATNTANDQLVYKSKFLSNIGYYPKDYLIHEIDELIRFCYKNFG